MCAAEQLEQVSREDKESLSVQFSGVNEGGLMAYVLGLRLFMPLSHLDRGDSRVYLTPQVRGGTPAVPPACANLRRWLLVVVPGALLHSCTARALHVLGRRQGPRATQPFEAFNTPAPGIDVAALQHIAATSMEVFTCADIYPRGRLVLRRVRCS